MGEILPYTTPDGTVSRDVKLERETVWFSQKQMALLFDKDSATIGLRIRNAYREGELEESATTEESSVVQAVFNEVYALPSFSRDATAHASP